MEVKINIAYHEFINFIQQLDQNQIHDLQKEIELIQKKKSRKEKKMTKEDFFEFILCGPLMSKEEYNQFLENRNFFTQWRTSEFV